jgi:acetyltransferase-like isoleucine patch superfamily enzyme
VIHPSAEVEEGARIGSGTRIWHHAHVRSGAVVGSECVLGYGVFVDAGAVIGDRCKLQNRVSVYRGVTLEDGVFVGPHAAFTNDRTPRAMTSDGAAAGAEDWTLVPTLVREGASIGAGAVVLPGITIGRWSMVAAGAVVTRDVPEHGLVMGNPARLRGYACVCGRTLVRRGEAQYCPHCDRIYDLPPLSDGP